MTATTATVVILAAAAMMTSWYPRSLRFFRCVVDRDTATAVATARSCWTA